MLARPSLSPFFWLACPLLCFTAPSNGLASRPPLPVHSMYVVLDCCMLYVVPLPREQGHGRRLRRARGAVLQSGEQGWRRLQEGVRVLLGRGVNPGVSLRLRFVFVFLDLRKVFGLAGTTTVDSGSRHTRIFFCVSFRFVPKTGLPTCCRTPSGVACFWAPFLLFFHFRSRWIWLCFAVSICLVFYLIRKRTK